MEAYVRRHVDVVPSQGRGAMVCRTPPFPGTRVRVSSTVTTFHAADGESRSFTPLREQRDPRDVNGCVSERSCGHCYDERPRTARPPCAWHHTDRVSCSSATPTAPPAQRRARVPPVDDEVPLLFPSSTAAQAESLSLANVSEPTAGNASAAAHGELLPEQMRYSECAHRTLQCASSSRPPLHAAVAHGRSPAHCAGRGDRRLRDPERAIPQSSHPRHTTASHPVPTTFLERRRQRRR